MELTDRVAVVTGACGDIGLATCLELAREGARVVAVDVEEARGQQVVAQITAVGTDARFCRADVRRAEDVKRYVNHTLQAFGRIDVFFNNAGITGSIIPMADYPEDIFDQVLAVNLKGAFLGLKHVLPVMVKQRSGSIINMASAAGLIGFAGFTGYVASKHGVIGLTRTAAAEFGGVGVRVNAVCPGPIEGTMMRSLETAINPSDPHAVVAQFLAANPSHRYGRPEEIARVVVFLASDKASYVNGAAWTVDGGVTAI